MHIQVETISDEGEDVIATFDCTLNRYNDLELELADAYIRPLVSGVKDRLVTEEVLASMGLLDELRQMAEERFSEKDYEQAHMESEGDRLCDLARELA